MEGASTDQYSAGKQGLGYIYQPRFALLKLFQLPESTSLLIEKDDDLDFLEINGVKTLGSLKHKAEGDRLTDLSTDFWKSVRIWLARYDRDGRCEANLRFFLFTTSTVSEASFLRRFRPDSSAQPDELASLSQLASDALAKSESELIGSIAFEFRRLSEEEREDFLSRIAIFDSSPRIVNVPSIIKDQHMRGILRCTAGMQSSSG